MGTLGRIPRHRHRHPRRHRREDRREDGVSFSACQRNNFRKSRVSDASRRVVVGVGVMECELNCMRGFTSATARSALRGLSGVV